MVVRLQLLLLILSGACVQEGLERAADTSNNLDPHYFRCEVQPILTKSCAFMDCHGNDERPLSIFAEQRFRLNLSWIDYEMPISDDELSANLKTVAGFVDSSQGAASLLSEKPLDSRFGGRYHRGRDLYGVDDVFLSREDEDYKTLRAFADGATASADCVAEVGGQP